MINLQYSFAARVAPEKLKSSQPAALIFEDNLKGELSMSEEIWKPVVGFEGWYEVSSHGRVKRLKRTIKRKNGIQCAYPSKILETTHKKNVAPYRPARFSKGNKRISVRVHRLVLSAFMGECPVGCEASHLDGNGFNNHLSNLKWESHKENIARIDQSKVRRNPAKGEKIGTSRLKEFQVLEIREKYATGKYTFTGLGKEYGIGGDSTRDIIKRSSWKHIV